MNRTMAALACLTLTLLVGRITDQTTGQPLAGVHVRIGQGRALRRAVTDAHGRFRLAGVAPGRHTLRYSSADVPPQSTSVTVSGRAQHLLVTACSTTLDYSCMGPGGGG